MINFRFLISISTLGLLLGCDGARSFDRNGDGIDDFFIEEDGDITYELLDNNFDGNVDESWQYEGGFYPVSGRVDSDFDGILETHFIYGNVYVTDQYVDTNKNGIPDIYTKYKDGTGVYSEKYYSLSRPGRGRIGRVEYDFGYPSAETFTLVSITEEEFAEQRSVQH